MLSSRLEKGLNGTDMTQSVNFDGASSLWFPSSLAHWNGRGKRGRPPQAAGVMGEGKRAKPSYIAGSMESTLYRAKMGTGITMRRITHALPGTGEADRVAVI